MTWGVLQAIGAAGLLALPLMRRKWPWRLGVALLLLAGYQVLLDRLWLERVVHSSHGGLMGTLSWAAMLLLSTVFADLFYHYHAARGSRHGRLSPGPAPAMATAGAVVVVAGALAAFLFPQAVPVSKHRVSASYVLITTGGAALLFALFVALDDTTRAPRAIMQRLLEPLAAWGANPLLLYLLHSFLLAIFVLPPAAGWYVEASPALVAAQLGALLAVVHTVAWLLRRRRVVISL